MRINPKLTRQTNRPTGPADDNKLQWLKLLAITAMVFDHVMVALAPQLTPTEQLYSRMPGRISIPIFAFLIAYNAAFHTRSIGKYIARIAALALISEPIYQCYFHYPVNAFVPLALGLAMVWTDKLQRLQRYAARVIILAMAMMCWIWLGWPEPMAITLAIWLCHTGLSERKITPIAAAAGILILANGVCWQFWLMILITSGLIALCCNTKKWPKLTIKKWAAYWFYPGHLLILLAIFH